jgi:hypothetical protein
VDEGPSDDVVLDALLDEGRRRGGREPAREMRDPDLRVIRDFLFELYGRMASSFELRDAVLYYARTGEIRSFRP